MDKKRSEGKPYYVYMTAGAKYTVNHEYRASFIYP